MDFMRLGGTGAELITHGLTEEEEKMETQRPGYGVRHACHQPTSVERDFFYINACLHRSSFLVLLRDECMVHSHSPLGVSLNAFKFFDPNVQVKTGKRSELSHGSCRSRQDPCHET